MRKTPLRPGPGPRRSREIARGAVELKRGRIRRQNAARKARAFARCYGSAERAEFVRGLPSVWDGAGPCVNAHVGPEGKGASRKANADQVVPLTDAQHRAYDRYLPPFDCERAREAVRACCADVERAWRAFVGAAA